MISSSSFIAKSLRAPGKNLKLLLVGTPLYTPTSTVYSFDIVTGAYEHCDCISSVTKLSLDDTVYQQSKSSGDDCYSKSLSVIMELRKIANHPLLVRHHYTNEKLRAMAVDILKVLWIYLQTSFSRYSVYYCTVNCVILIG